MPFIEFPKELIDIYRLIEPISSPAQEKEKMVSANDSISMRVNFLMYAPSTTATKELRDTVWSNALDEKWTQLSRDVSDASIPETHMQDHFTDFKGALQKVFNVFANALQHSYRGYAQAIGEIKLDDTTTPLNYLALFEKIERTHRLVNRFMKEDKIEEAFSALLVIPYSEDKANLLNCIGVEFLRKRKNLKQALSCYRLMNGDSSLKEGLLDTIHRAAATDDTMLTDAFEYINSETYPDEIGLFIEMSKDFLAKGEHVKAYEILCAHMEAHNRLMSEETVMQKIQSLEKKVQWEKRIRAQSLEVLHKILASGNLEDAIKMVAHLKRLGIDEVYAIVLWIERQPGNSAIKRWFAQDFLSDRELTEVLYQRVEMYEVTQNALVSLFESKELDSEEESPESLRRKNDVNNNATEMELDFSSLSFEPSKKRKH